MRERLYEGLAPSFHDEEMEIIFASQEATCFMGISDAGKAVAMLEVSLRNFVDGCLGGPVGYIEGIYVVPEARGRRYGGKLVEFAESWFRTKGCRDMAADSVIDNVEAQRFFQHIGFEETFRIVQFKKPLDGA